MQTSKQFTYKEILGALAKLRKTTISIIVSVRMPAWNNSVVT